MARDSIMKTLLTSPNTNGELRRKYQPYNLSEGSECDDLKLTNHLLKSSGKPVDKNMPCELDHSYCRPCNWRPENSFMKPADFLFYTKPDTSNVPDDDIDVVGEEHVWKPYYDVGKAKILMDECKKHISLVRAEEGDMHWEAKIDRTGWTQSQTRLFERTVKLLYGDRLGRLAIAQNHNEPMLRRILVNKSARRFRTLMSHVFWDVKLTQWLHKILMDNLEKSYLVAYVEILQTLKSKIPVLIGRMLQGFASSLTNSDALNVLIQRPWDPATLIYPGFSLKKLPDNPILLMVPGTVGTKTSRVNRWHKYLEQLGKLQTISTSNIANSKLTLVNCLDHMLSATRQKLNELRKEFPNRQIILVGVHSGAALAAQVALLDPVNALVCLGFPTRTVEGPRGLPDDNLTCLTTPVFFVIGQRAVSTSIDEIEELRENLANSETGLVVVGGADDLLRVPKSIQHTDGITQHVIDRCIIEEVGDFLAGVGTRKEEAKRQRLKLLERKRKLSSQEEGPESPPQSTPSHQAPPSTTISASPRRGTGRRPRGTRGRGRGARQIVMRNNTSPIKLSGRGRYSNISKQVESIKRNLSESSGSTTIYVSDVMKHNVVTGEGLIASGSQMSYLESGNLVDQLTPDRLLEMPIIIAHEDSPPQQPQQTPVKAILVRRGGRGSRGLKSIGRSSLQPKCTQIILRNDGTKSGKKLLSVSGLEEAGITLDSKTRVFHIPATQYTE